MNVKIRSSDFSTFSKLIQTVWYCNNVFIDVDIDVDVSLNLVKLHVYLEIETHLMSKFENAMISALLFLSNQFLQACCPHLNPRESF